MALLHTMVVLQAYQTDLLRDLDRGEGLFPDQVAELRRTTGLSPGYQAAMVVAKRLLWMNLADIGKKEKAFFSMLRFRLLNFSVFPLRR